MTKQEFIDAIEASLGATRVLTKGYISYEQEISEPARIDQIFLANTKKIVQVVRGPIAIPMLILPGGDKFFIWRASPGFTLISLPSKPISLVFSILTFKELFAWYLFPIET